MSVAPASSPRLAGVVVHWRNEDELAALAAAWPADPRFALVVVDNSASAPESPRYRRLLPPGNLGFAGGVQLALTASEAPLLLILNPDAAPRPGALEALLDAFDRYPEAAGIVPALEGPDGTSQCRWQLRPLPSPIALLLQTLRFAGVHGPREEPPEGTPVAQPAAAALALRRDALEATGGFDTRYYPAWFEDVDLARRFADRGAVLRFAPGVRFVHRGGASVPRLGYGPFLWIYYRHLARYLARHHGPAWARLARLSLIAGMVARMAALPMRRPRQAPSRRAALRALADVVTGALTDWSKPARLRDAYRPERPW